MDAPSNNEVRLRAIVSLVNETLPVLRKMIRSQRGHLPAAVISRLEAQERLDERLLRLALHTLSNLPDEPEELAATLAEALLRCSALATQN